MTAAETSRVAILVKGESGRAEPGLGRPLRATIPAKRDHSHRSRGRSAAIRKKKSGTGVRVDKIRLTVSEIEFLTKTSTTIPTCGGAGRRESCCFLSHLNFETTSFTEQSTA